MTTAGFLVFICSNAAILSLVVYCFYRVLRSPDVSETEHAPLDIDTRDLD